MLLNKQYPQLGNTKGKDAKVKSTENLLSNIIGNFSTLGKDLGIQTEEAYEPQNRHN